MRPSPRRTGNISILASTSSVAITKTVGRTPNLNLLETWPLRQPRRRWRNRIQVRQGSLTFERCSLDLPAPEGGTRKPQRKQRAATAVTGPTKILQSSAISDQGRTAGTPNNGLRLPVQLASLVDTEDSSEAAKELPGARIFFRTRQNTTHHHYLPGQLL